MQMKISSAVTVLVGILLSTSVSARNGNCSHVTSTTIDCILKTPEKYNGITVSFVGYIISTPHRKLIYQSRESNNAIVLDIPESIYKKPSTARLIKDSFDYQKPSGLPKHKGRFTGKIQRDSNGDVVLILDQYRAGSSP